MLTRRVLVVVLWLFWSAPAHAAIVYSLEDLGTLGGTFSDAVAINNAGEVVGAAAPVGQSSPGGAHAFLYVNSKMMDLGVPFGTSSAAVGVNSTGQVALFSSGSAGERSFLYANGVSVDLGDLGGSPTEAHGINDAGQVVGESNGLPFVYSNGAINASPLGQRGTISYGINNSGHIVGSIAVTNTVTGQIETHAFLYSNGATQDIGAPFGGTISIARAISNSGNIVGGSVPGGFLYSDGKVTIVDPQGGAYGVNNLGDVVGVDEKFGAYLYHNGTLSNLNDLVDPSSALKLAAALGINDSGQIVGYGYTASGDQHAFLLTPIPEPQAVALLAAAGLLLRRRKS